MTLSNEKLNDLAADAYEELEEANKLIFTHPWEYAEDDFRAQDWERNH